MESNSPELERFLKAIEEIFTGINPKTFWPLNGGQIDAYFDIDESLDMYYRLHKLRERLSVAEIAKMMPSADIIRIFLEHNAIIGLKVADKVGVAKISAEERVKYTLFLFEILKQKVKNDIFCLDGKNLLLSEPEVSGILSQGSWNQPHNDEEKRKIASLIVTANNVCYTLFYDIYVAGGFHIHGPYDASQKFGKDTILLIREYHHLNPQEIWPHLEMPYRQLRMYLVYQNLDLKINFANHPTSTTSVGDKLIAYQIHLDGQEIRLADIDGLINIFEKISLQQIKKINGLSDLDKVRKGVEIAYFLFKDLREKMGDQWKPPLEIERTIQKRGDKYIQQFKYKEKPSLDFWKKIFDPRNDYY